MTPVERVPSFFQLAQRAVRDAHRALHDDAPRVDERLRLLPHEHHRRDLRGVREVAELERDDLHAADFHLALEERSKDAVELHDFRLERRRSVPGFVRIQRRDALQRRVRVDFDLVWEVQNVQSRSRRVHDAVVDDAGDDQRVAVSIRHLHGGELHGRRLQGDHLRPAAARVHEVQTGSRERVKKPPEHGRDHGVFWVDGHAAAAERDRAYLSGVDGTEERETRRGIGTCAVSSSRRRGAATDGEVSTYRRRDHA